METVINIIIKKYSINKALQLFKNRFMFIASQKHLDLLMDLSMLENQVITLILALSPKLGKVLDLVMEIKGSSLNGWKEI